VDLPQTQYTKSGDVSIAYQVLGDGPFDLVWVPGFVTHLENSWQNPALAAFIRNLASFCRLIRFDKRGTGMSDRAVSFPASTSAWTICGRSWVLPAWNKRLCSGFPKAVRCLFYSPRLSRPLPCASALWQLFAFLALVSDRVGAKRDRSHRKKTIEEGRCARPDAQQR
jgi:hypothetical protein